jgi:hypothetical protein
VSVAVGEPVLLSLHLRNDSPGTVLIDPQQVGVNDSLDVFGPDGSKLPSIAPTVQTTGGFRSLEPGQTLALFDNLDLAKQYALTEPGVYRVRFNGRGLQVAEPMPEADAPWHPVAALMSDRRFASDGITVELLPPPVFPEE